MDPLVSDVFDVEQRLTSFIVIRRRRVPLGDVVRQSVTLCDVL